MKADAGDIWELISDVTRIGSYSPETFEAEWLDGATGPQVGALFRGHVKRNGRGPVYWTTCKVIASQPGREFAFAVVNRDKPINTWRYVLTPRDGGGTDVTESFQLADNPMFRIYWMLAGRARGKTNERGMRQTLERIRDQVDAPAA